MSRSRPRVDLSRLPAPLRYGVALLTVSLVVVLAVQVDEDPEVPGWLSEYLVPGLAWLFLGLLVLRLAVGRRSTRRGGVRR